MHFIDWNDEVKRCKNSIDYVIKTNRVKIKKKRK